MAKVIATVFDPKRMIPQTGQEVCFVGRSNAGKSSLINALLNEKLARVSRDPGRTRSINFYEIAKNLTLVDLPGYGFAKIAKEDRESWFDLMRAFFESREGLRSVFLMDARRDLDEEDVSILKMLSSKGDVCVALTKADKLSKAQLTKRENLIKEQIKSFHLETYLLSVSSYKKINLTSLKSFINF